MNTLKIKEIGKEFYLIRSEEKDFHRNIYIKRFLNNAGEIRSILFDPGTKLDLTTILPALDGLIGGVKNLNYIFLSHQDPDVTANLGMMSTAAPSSFILSSIDTWRLVKMYGIEEKRFVGIENFNNKRVVLKGFGQRIFFIPAPFVHFKGAMMLYDEESEVLFTGDFMGGLNTRNGDGVYADESSWEGISLFHQIYMPTHKALESVVNKIGLLPRLPKIIAPQHGDVIGENLSADFLERISKLKTGLDLVAEQSETKDLSILAINSFLDNLKHTFPDIYKKLQQSLSKPNNFTTFFAISSNTVIDIKVDAKNAISSFAENIFDNVSEKDRSVCASLLSNILSEYGIEAPKNLINKTNAHNNNLNIGLTFN